MWTGAAHILALELTELLAIIHTYVERRSQHKLNLFRIGLISTYLRLVIILLRTLLYCTRTPLICKPASASALHAA